MGCFDSIFFKCPNCKEYIEAQTKWGECSLRRYHSRSVPASMADGIHGDIIQCDKCSNSYRVINNTSERVACLLEPYSIEEKEEDWD